MSKNLFVCIISFGVFATESDVVGAYSSAVLCDRSNCPIVLCEGQTMVLQCRKQRVVFTDQGTVRHQQ